MTAFQPRNPDFRTFVQGYVEAQGFLTMLGVRLVCAEPGFAEYRLPFRLELGQQDGVFHGGCIGAVAEGVMGAAAATLVAPGANVVGASYTLNLLAPGRGEAIAARGSVLRAGRRLIVCRVDVLAIDAHGGETLCAAGQGAMAVVDPPAQMQ